MELWPAAMQRHLHPHLSMWICAQPPTVRQTDREVHNRCLTTDTHRKLTHPSIHSPSLVYSWPVQSSSSRPHHSAHSCIPAVFHVFYWNNCGLILSKSSPHLGMLNNVNIPCKIVSSSIYGMSIWEYKKGVHKSVCPTAPSTDHYRHHLGIYLIPRLTKV